MNLTHKLVGSIKQNPSVMWAGLIKLVDILNRTKSLNSSEQEGILPAQCFALFFFFLNIHFYLFRCVRFQLLVAACRIFSWSLWNENY